MVPETHPQTEHDPEGLICCRRCRGFQFLENTALHNSPHAPGECRGDPWDGSLGQWGMFQHHCSAFEAVQN